MAIGQAARYCVVVIFRSPSFRSLLASFAFVALVAACSGGAVSATVSGDAGDAGGLGNADGSTDARVSTDAGAEAAPPPLSEDQFVTAYVNAVCTTARPAVCTTYARTFFDEQVCRTHSEEDIRQTIARAKAAGDTFDGDAANACVAAVIANLAVRSNAANIVAQSRRQKACADVFKGRRKNVNDACQASEECAAPAAGVAACSSGVCIVRSIDALGANGDACGSQQNDGSAPRITCDEGLVCYGATCTQRAGAGGACDGSNCADGLVCTSGACAASWPSAGSPCKNGVYCAPETASCDSQTRMCIPVAGVGEACDPMGLSSSCHSGSTCATNAKCMPDWVWSVCG